MDQFKNQNLEESIILDRQTYLQLIGQNKKSFTTIKKTNLQQICQPKGDTSLDTTMQGSSLLRTNQLQTAIMQSIVASNCMRNQQLSEMKNISKLDPNSDIMESVIIYQGQPTTVYGVQQQAQINKVSATDERRLKQNTEDIFNPQPESLEELIIRRGILQKKSNKMMGGYKDTICTLQGRIFKCSKNIREPRTKCILNFQLYLFDCQMQSENEFVYRLDLNQNPCSRNQPIISLQVTYVNIQTIIRTCHCERLRFFPTFWKRPILTNSQFLQQAQPGDIILFKGKSMTCRFQRLLTGSEYDHVGLVLRYRGGKVYIFEATGGGSGVGMFNWDSMMTDGWHELYEKHLNTKRNLEFMMTLQSFVEKHYNSSYKLSVSKILKNESVILVHLSSIIKQSQVVEQKRTFFCSELVAAAYKSVGLLPQLKSSTQYWPGSFSEENKELNLLKNSNLEDEQVVVFDLQ